MSEREKLPAKPAAHAVAVSAGQGSLVARALSDLQAGKERPPPSQRTASESDPEKLFLQGMRYRDGLDGTPEDHDKARACLLLAAKFGHAEAQFELALLLSVKGEEAEAKQWLESASNLGYGPAQYTYAAYDLPEGEADVLLQKAFAWYAKRAEEGNPEMQFEFAMFHVRGDVVAADRAQGLRWLKAAADQDYRPACRRLGEEYLRAEVN